MTAGQLNATRSAVIAMQGGPAAERDRLWLERVGAALHMQGMQAAGQLSLQALAAGVAHPTLLNLAGAARYGEGRFDEAAELLTRAQSLAPNDPNVLNSLGVCLQAAGRTDEAIEAYGAALEADPTLAPAHYNRGALLELAGNIQMAREAYESAIGLEPSYAEPLASLAWLDAQVGDTDSAEARATAAVRLSPGNHLARLAMATACIQRGNHADAASILHALEQDAALGPVNRSIALGLMADLLDAENRPAEAFAAYSAGNAIVKNLHAGRFEGPGQETALAQAWRLEAWFGKANLEQWRRAPEVHRAATDPKMHVFLVGFPRSGTTLLENVLAAHPDVVSLEEKNCLEKVAFDYLGSNQSLARLGTISNEEADKQRNAYWDAVRGSGVEPAGKVFIDKFPLSSVSLPVIAKLFPRARILFAVRDPRDVVLSCFRRRFAMNPAMYQLLTLEGSAAFYDAVMWLAARYRQILPLKEQIVRYESLVDDFGGTVRGVCEFVGLDWHEDMADFASKAHLRAITTPSAAQVARGLNRDGQGVWHRYARQMAPVLPLLDPWVREFGYS